MLQAILAAFCPDLVRLMSEVEIVCFNYMYHNIIIFILTVRTAGIVGWAVGKS
jgi:hypothetical protein